MNTQMPHFEWSEEDKAKLKAGATLTEYWELGVTPVTLYDGGVFCPDSEEPKLRIGPDKYVIMAHCDPKTLKGPDDNKAA